MSAPPREYRRYARGSARRRAALLRRATGGMPALSPDIPAPLDNPRNAGCSTGSIEHTLAPDAVHALGVLWPAGRDPAADVAVVQLSRAILRRLGHAEVGARIAASRELRGRPVRLLLAGTATGHDSVADYPGPPRWAYTLPMLRVVRGRTLIEIDVG